MLYATTCLVGPSTRLSERAEASTGSPGEGEVRLVAIKTFRNGWIVTLAP
jgi:hypothetical protein